MLASILAFLKINPTVPIIALTALVALANWRSQQRLTRAKHAIDLQNNYVCSERVLKDMYRVADLSKKLSTEEVERLSKIDATTPATEGDRANLESIRNVLNCFERMAIGIQQDVYDEGLLFNSYATFVTDVWTSFRPYIRAKQVGNNRYYKAFDWLAVNWMTKKEAIRMKEHRG
jgi:hypothetical protein